MRTRSREINIFSMSALDLFASALGAFILIAVVLFPYFPNTGDSKVRVAAVQDQLVQAPESVASLAIATGTSSGSIASLAIAT